MNLTDLKHIPLWPFKSRMIAIGVICAAVICFIYYFELSFVLAKLHSARSEETELKQGLEAAIKKQAKLQANLASYKDVKAQYDAWQNKFITDDALLELLNDILKIGAKNKLIFNSFDPGDKIADGNYFKIPIIIKVAGDYSGFASFLSQVANLPWTVAIRKFTINRPTEQNSKSELNADLVLEIYTKNGSTTHAA
jgi:Tfp pilus assembly protein PilO